MPTLSIDLTANQVQRVAAAFGVASNAEATDAIKKILKEKVREFEARADANVAFDSARAKVDTDFAGF